MFNPYNYLTRQNKIGIQQLVIQTPFYFLVKTFFRVCKQLLSYSSGENLLLKIVHITTSSYTARIILRYVITQAAYEISDCPRCFALFYHFMRGTCRGFQSEMFRTVQLENNGPHYSYTSLVGAPIGKYTSAVDLCIWYSAFKVVVLSVLKFI